MRGANERITVVMSVIYYAMGEFCHMKKRVPNGRVVRWFLDCMDRTQFCLQPYHLSFRVFLQIPAHSALHETQVLCDYARHQ